MEFFESLIKIRNAVRAWATLNTTTKKRRLSRHSKAMHLLQAGVNLVYIRDLLGHVSVQTTEIYARADSRQKQEAFEKAYVDLNPNAAKTKKHRITHRYIMYYKD